MVEILIKPETILFCRNELIEFLFEKGFSVNSVSKISNWNDLSVKLYEKSEKVTRRQLELQNILRKQIMGTVGNDAEIWGLQYRYDLDTIGQYFELGKLKRIFRAMFWQEGLTINIEYNGEKSIYHFTYFHTSDPDETIINSESTLWREYIDEMGDI